MDDYYEIAKAASLAKKKATTEAQQKVVHLV